MKFIPCRKCKSKEGSRIPDGYYLSKIIVNGVPQVVAIECDCHKVWVKDEKDRKNYISAGFNPLLFEKTLNDYVGDKSIFNVNRLKSYLKLFSEKDTVETAKSVVMYFYGTNGTQKTTVSCAIGSYLIKHGFDARYILMKNLVDDLWNSQRDNEALARVKSLSECDVLVLDESFSKDKIHMWASGNQVGYIDEFLRERINKGLGIIFISNTRPEIISTQGFSDSIQDLVLRQIKACNTFMEFKDRYFDIVDSNSLKFLF